MAKELSIVHVITGLGRGGAETMLLKLLQHVDSSRSRHSVVSLISDGCMSQEIRALGIDVTALQLERYPLRVHRLCWVLRRARPDVIHAWMYHANVIVTLVSWLASPGAAVIWGIRHTPYVLAAEKPTTRAVIRIGRVLSRSPDAVVYNAHASLERHTALGYRNRRSLVIPNGFDTEEFRPSRDAHAALRSELGIGGDAVTLGVIARFHPIKGYDVFFKAAAILAAKHPNLHFILVGRDVTYRNVEIQRFLMTGCLAQRVHLLGERSDVSWIMPGLDMLVSPSRSEAFSNVIGEAMACGVPCVVTDTGDSPHIVGSAGLVVPPNEPDALARGVERLIQLEEHGRAQLGEEARRRIIEKFGISGVARQYLDLYSSLPR